MAALIAGLALPAFLLLADVEIVAYHLPTYRQSFAANQTTASTGFTPDQLIWTMTRTLDYATGRSPDLQFDLARLDGGQPGRPAFTAIEVQHMVDVRVLLGLARSVRWVALGLTVAGVVAALALDRRRVGFRQATARLARGLIVGSAVFLLAWGVLAVATLVDFSSFWTAFHEALFTNELWLLPEDSLLIRMLPESLFQTLALKIVGLLTAELLLIFGLSGLYLRRRNP